MEIKTSFGNEYEESVSLYGTLRKETEECLAALSTVADAGDLNVLKERIKAILLSVEELEAKGKAYNETLIEKRGIAERYSRLTIKG